MRKTGIDFSRYAVAAAAIGTIAATEKAAADFSTPYGLSPPANGTYPGGSAIGTFGNWSSSLTVVPQSGSGSDSLVTNAPASVQFNLSNFNGTGIVDTWDLTTTAVASGLVSFSWNFVENVSNPSLGFGYTLNNVFTQLASGTSQSGNSSFAVTAGNTFGFRLIAAYQAVGSITISNFSAPVPEPSIMVLIAAGTVGLVALREARRRYARK